MDAILNALLWLDVKVFAIITFGRALPGETMSAAAYNGERTGKIIGKLARPVIDLLFRPWQRPLPPGVAMATEFIQGMI